jgi:hypothetical protein
MFTLFVEYRKYAVQLILVRIQALRPPLSPNFTNALYQNVSIFGNGDIKHRSVILKTPGDSSSTVRSVINSSTNERKQSVRFRVLRPTERKSVESNRDMYRAVCGMLCSPELLTNYCYLQTDLPAMFVERRM